MVAAIVVEDDQIEADVKSDVSVLLTTSEEYQTDSDGSENDQGEDPEEMKKILAEFNAEVERQVNERLEKEE